MGYMKEFHCKQAHWCEFGEIFGGRAAIQRDKESKQVRIKQWVHYLPFYSTFAFSETIAIAGSRHFVLTNNTGLFFPAIVFCHSVSKSCSQRPTIVQPNTISSDTVISSGAGKKRTISSQHFITGTIRASTLRILHSQCQKQTQHKKSNCSYHLFFLLGQFDHSIVFCFLFFKFDAVVIWIIDIINLLDNLFTLFAYQFLKGQKEKGKM